MASSSFCRLSMRASTSRRILSGSWLNTSSFITLPRPAWALCRSPTASSAAGDVPRSGFSAVERLGHRSPAPARCRSSTAESAGRGTPRTVEEQPAAALLIGRELHHGPTSTRPRRAASLLLLSRPVRIGEFSANHVLVGRRVPPGPCRFRLRGARYLFGGERTEGPKLVMNSISGLSEGEPSKHP